MSSKIVPMTTPTSPQGFEFEGFEDTMHEPEDHVEESQSVTETKLLGVTQSTDFNKQPSHMAINPSSTLMVDNDTDNGPTTILNPHVQKAHPPPTVLKLKTLHEHDSVLDRLTHGRRTRTCVRLFGMFFLWCILFFVISGLSTLIISDFSGDIDITKNLQIDVSGCDVYIESTNDAGTIGSVKMRSSWFHLGPFGSFAFDFDTAGQRVIGVYGRSDGCSSDAKGLCASTCLVTITVPKATDDVDAGKITITQLSDGGAQLPSVVQATNGTVIRQQLHVFGSNIRVNMTDVSIGKFFFKTGGSLSLRSITPLQNTSGNTMLSREGNIHYSVAHSVSSFALDLSLRQPSRRYRIRTNAKISTSDVENDANVRCAGNLNGAGATTRTVRFYDTNSDGVVGIDEYREGITTKLGKCCSNTCPTILNSAYVQSTNCDVQVNAIFPNAAQFPSDNGFTRYGQITVPLFLQQLQNTNDTTLFPFCSDSVQLAPVDTTTISTTMSLSSDKGEIEVEYLPTSGDSTNVTSTTSGEIPTTMKLLESSAIVLRDVANRYGQRNDADKDIYLVIVCDYGPHLPDSYFVYVSRVVHLTVDPSVLNLMGNKLLTPATKTVRAEFTLGPEWYTDTGFNENNTIDPILTDGDNTTAVEFLKVQTYGLLKQALTPIGQLNLRGDLVRIVRSKEEYRTTGVSDYKLLKLASGISLNTDGSVDFGASANSTSPEVNVNAGSDAQTVMGLNLGLSILFALGIYGVISKYATWKLQFRKRTLKISKQRASELSAGTKEQQTAAALANDIDSGLLHATLESWWFTPFEIPVEMLQVLIPYRFLMFNSFQKFWTSSVVVLDDASTTSRQKGVSPSKGVRYRRFLHAYQRYCDNNGFKPEEDEMKIRANIYLGAHAYNRSFCDMITGKETEGKMSPVQIKNRLVRTIVGVKLKFAYMIQLRSKLLERKDSLEGDEETFILAPLSKLFAKKESVDWTKLKMMVEAASLFNDILEDKVHPAVEIGMLDLFLRTCCEVETPECIANSETKTKNVSLVDFLDALKDFTSALQLGCFDGISAETYSKVTAPAVQAEIMNETTVSDLHPSDPDQTDVGRYSRLKMNVFETPELNDILESKKLELRLRQQLQIYGIQLAPRIRITRFFFYEVFIDSLILMVYVLVPAIAVLYLAFQAHLAHLQTTAVVKQDVRSAANVYEFVLGASNEYYPLSYTLFVLTLVMSIVQLISVLLHYTPLNANNKSMFALSVKRIFGILTASYYFIVVVLITMVLLWQTVAAVVDPEQNLAQGAAVVTVVVSLQGIVSRLCGLRSIVREQIHDNLNKKLDEKLKNVKKSDKHVLDSDSREDKYGGLEAMFDKLDVNGDGSLDYTEFRDLFLLLDFNIPNELQHSMFHFADIDNSNSVSKENFAKSWDYLLDFVSETVINRLKLSDSDIIVAVMYIVGVFALVFPFLFLAIQLYTNQGTFATVMHSIFIGITGVFANKRKSHVEEKAQKKDFLDDAINMAMESAGVSEESKTTVEEFEAALKL